MTKLPYIGLTGFISKNKYKASKYINLNLLENIKKMNNKTGFILGLVSGIIYTLINYGNFFRFLDFIFAFIGALIIPLIFTFLISLFSKSLASGRTFGIMSIAIHIIATIGNLNS